MREGLIEWSRKKGSIRSVFEKMDEDRSGAIEKDELRRLLRQLKIDVDEDELRAVLECLDIDGDGQITYEEFSTFVNHVPEGDEIGAIHARILKALKK